jgi:hypothetical protein
MSDRNFFVPCDFTLCSRSPHCFLDYVGPALRRGDINWRSSQMKYAFSAAVGFVLLAGATTVHAQSMGKPAKPAAMADSQHTSAMAQDSAKHAMMKPKADAMGKKSEMEMTKDAEMKKPMSGDAKPGMKASPKDSGMATKKPMAKDSSMMKKPPR